jgi:hypothetical protein
MQLLSLAKMSSSSALPVILDDRVKFALQVVLKVALQSSVVFSNPLLRVIGAKIGNVKAIGRAAW